MDVRATYNLPLNAKFVRQGIGSAFTYRGLFEANELNDLAFVPAVPHPWNPPRASSGARPSPPAKPKLFWIR